jgi:predicted RNase H-like nuclease (RuvC/YqgF family)
LRVTKNIPLKGGGEKTVEVELVKLIIDKSPALAIIIVVCIFGGKYINSFIKEYRTLKREKDARERADEQALIQEGREFGHIESERDAYKSNSNTLKEEYYKQQVKINELDKQVNDLTNIVRVESEERKKDGERLDSLIRIHDNLSKNYSDMGESLKKSLSEMGEALTQFQFNNRKMHEKITDMEDDISSIKSDVKELKELQTQEGKK